MTITLKQLLARSIVGLVAGALLVTIACVYPWLLVAGFCVMGFVWALINV